MEFEKLLGLLETSYWRVLLTALIVIVLALIVHRLGAALIWRLTRNLPVSSVVLHAIRYIKLRLFAHGGVANPRNSGTIAPVCALP